MTAFISDEALAAHLRTLEERLLDPGVRRNAAEVSRLLAEDFVEFGSSGRRYTKAEMIEALLLEAEEAVPQLGLSDFVCRMLSPDVALVTYVSHRVSQGGQVIRSLRSSTWKKDGTSWRLFFHQGTRAAVDPAARGTLP